MNRYLYAALGALALAGGAYVLTSDATVEIKPVVTHTFEAVGIADCDQAKLADKLSAIACESGLTQVKVRLEVPEGEDPVSYAKSQGYQVFADTVVDAGKLDLAAVEVEPALEPCIAGLVSRDTSEKGDWSQVRTWKEPHVCCGGTRCRCDAKPGDKPCVTAPDRGFAGLEVWRARLEEAPVVAVEEPVGEVVK